MWRHRTVRLGSICLVMIATVSPVRCHGAEQTTRLQSLLDLAGWPTERLIALANGEVTRERELELLQLAQRLDRFDEVLAAGEQAGATTIAGRVVAARGIELTDEEAARFGLRQFYECLLEREQGGPATRVYTLAEPQAWLAAKDLNQPAVATGLLLPGNDAAQQRTLVTPRIAWYPESADGTLVNFGESVLGSMQFDVGLLDRLIDGQPLLSRERQTFYHLLAAIQEVGANQLARFARGNLGRYTKGWQEASGDSPLGKIVAKKAGQGSYSVAPLFNDAIAQRGELFVFDGVVRRALRVDASDALEEFGIDHYFELELFTGDSQNLPLVFCVLELPDGFPTGERIAQDARVAGFFLKRWAYRTRKPADTVSRSHDKRQLAPLLIGRAPQLLAPPPSSGPSTGLIAGGAFVLALAAIWLSVWRLGRADRAFDKQVRERFSPGRDDVDFAMLADGVQAAESDADD